MTRGERLTSRMIRSGLEFDRRLGWSGSEDLGQGAQVGSGRQHPLDVIVATLERRAQAVAVDGPAAGPEADDRDDGHLRCDDSRIRRGRLRERSGGSGGWHSRLFGSRGGRHERCYADDRDGRRQPRPPAPGGSGSSLAGA